MSGSGKTIADIIQEKRGKETAACYQIVDGRSRSKMLTAEPLSEKSFLLAYSDFRTARINAEATWLEAEFNEKILLLRGRGLEPVFAGLSDHRVTYLRQILEDFPFEMPSTAITSLQLTEKG